MEQLELVPTRIKVASIIRKAILSGEFIAGEELTLTTMAERLGVSRTPVREAFQTLATEGLIELRMNKGAIVKSIDEDFITDHFSMRILLEGQAVAQAIRQGMTPFRLEELQRNILIAPDFSARYEEYNQKFHQAIWTAAKSQKLYNFCEALWNGPSFSKSVSNEEHRRKSLVEHERIIACIFQGDAEEGQKAMAVHIERSMENILQGFRQQNKGG